MSKLTIIAATLAAALVAFPVSAQYQPITNPHAYCNAIARYAESVAYARDNGASLVQVLGLLGQSPAGRARDDMTTVVDIVFTEPHAASGVVTGVAFELCWATYGE